jgi:uncharacterized membrane protein
MPYFIVQFLPIVGIISVIYFGIQASKYPGEFTNKVIFKYSAIFSLSLTIPTVLTLFGAGLETLKYDSVPILLIILTSTGLFFVHWKFYRYVARKAEEAGRSYAAFLVLAILFGFITLLVVSLFKSDTKDQSSAAPTRNSAGNSLDIQLANLQELRNQGALSEEEFARAKAKLIS